jgi:hypothetical protein
MLFSSMLQEIDRDNPAFLLENRAEDTKTYVVLLHMAIAANAVRCLDALIEMDPKLVSSRLAFRPPLHSAMVKPKTSEAMLKRLHVIQKLLAAGADVNCHHPREPFRTPLQMLVHDWRQVQVLQTPQDEWLTLCGRFLIQAGADVSFLRDEKHELRVYAVALKRARTLRVALWLSLRASELVPRDVARFLLSVAKLIQLD